MYYNEQIARKKRTISEDEFLMNDRRFEFHCTSLKLKKSTNEERENPSEITYCLTHIKLIKELKIVEQTHSDRRWGFSVRISKNYRLQ